MTRSSDLNRVEFTSAAADQALLQAVQAAIAAASWDSFSDLCKHALRQLLQQDQAPTSVVLWGEMQRQIVELQFKLTALEGRLTAEQALMQQQAAQHNLRLQSLEQELHPDQSVSPTAAMRARQLDPLLSRIGPLLEDF